jgi:predicted dienelactone hydrolase
MKRLMAWALMFIAAQSFASQHLSSTHSLANMPGVDAPELATMQSAGIGYKTVVLTHASQPDFQSPNANANTVPVHDRKLAVDIWYPAVVRKGDKYMRYSAAFWGEPPNPPVIFNVKGVAVLNAKGAGQAHPIVIVSHGYSNAPASMTWLTENLASKGYVVAAIRHADPNPYVISADKRAAPNFHRPMDISYVAKQLKIMLGPQIDPSKIALIGYSQGGYGALTAGGATLDPKGANMSIVAGGWLRKYARGMPDAAEMRVPDVKAIIALAPAGGFPNSAWGREGLAAITSPMLLIQGDADPVVDYKTGALAVFDGAVNSDRYLLTFKQAGHAIAHNPVPDEMRGSVWDMDWFEDPIWRNDRINAINLHFITAFLAVHLRGEGSRAEYLNVPVENSDDGVWNAPAGTPWGAFSPGGDGVTLWKGFQRRHARGMELQHLRVGE